VGGMGEVYLAQDTQLDRPVALKVMSAELAKDPNQRKRFRTEAKAASGLMHPHICVVHEVGETEDGRPFLAMEYVEGHTLDAVLRERRLKMREVINLGIEVAEALDAAHARGLVHRDIKPANVMLDRRGRAKVMDFGLAKWFALEESSATTTSVAHTRTGMLIGTPQYMSPEQALGRALGPHTDIFSLGVLLYELVAGQRPFLGKTVGEVINNIVNQPPAPLGLENPVFSPELDNIIFKCLEKAPEKRYGSAQELAGDLRKLKEDSERALSATAHDKLPTPVSTVATPQPALRVTRAGTSHRAALGWAFGCVAVAVAALGGWALFRGGGVKPPEHGITAPSTVTQKSVAVLPFVNMSADKADEYLSDGMTEELLNALTKVKGLRVPGRSSSFAFKGQNAQDIFRKVGAQLQVQTVLEGSVRKAGEKLRITAQLISVADGFHLWSETYDRDMTNIFTIQSEIASRVAEALKVQLLGAAREPTQNIEAYKLYLQGRYWWNRRTSEGLKQAIVYFNQAIGKDPGYALAHAGLADCYCVMRDYDVYAKDRQTFPQARAAALKALELDSTLAQARVAMADVKAYLDWDWSGAEVEFRRAIELNPNYATAHQWLGRLLLVMRRPKEALAEIQEALDLDPLSPIINDNLGELLFRNGQTDLGIEVLQKQVARDPSFVVAHGTLAWVYYHQGKLSESIAELETQKRLLGSEINGLGRLAAAHARAGRTSEAQKILGRMQELQRQGIDCRVDIASVQHELGDDEAALDSLEKAAEEHAAGLEYLNCDIGWKDLRPHPRAQAILRKMNLVK
jgi:eukaryotic-like serine/threonine-protein kinase